MHHTLSDWNHPNDTMRNKGKLFEEVETKALVSKVGQIRVIIYHVMCDQFWQITNSL